MARPEPQTFITRLAIDECQAKLRGLTEPERILGAAGDPDKPLVGAIGPTGFRVRKAIAYRNSFQPEVHGTWSPSEGDTLIAVRTRNPSAEQMVWFVVGCSALALLVCGATRFTASPLPWLAFLVPAAILAIGFGVRALSLRLASGEAETVAAIVTDALEARRMAHVASPSPAAGYRQPAKVRVSAEPAPPHDDAAEEPEAQRRR